MAHTQVSPGMTPLPSRLCPSHLRPRLPYRVWTLTIFAVSSDALASMRFLFVEPAFCLRLPSSSPSRSRTCRAASTSSCQVCNELSSSGRCALPGAQKKPRPPFDERGFGNPFTGFVYFLRKRRETSVNNPIPIIAIVVGSGITTCWLSVKDVPPVMSVSVDSGGVPLTCWDAIGPSGVIGPSPYHVSLVGVPSV